MSSTITPTIYDATPCQLGEGPLWHPLRKQLYWFDIIGKRLYTQQNGQQISWEFDEMVSAAGWVDHDTLLVASALALYRFNVETGKRKVLTNFEADNPLTRSNDGRTDPFGGFWIGTMGYNGDIGLGKIYRYYKGELTVLYKAISIPNSICFSPDRNWAYFSDTKKFIINRVALDSEGWPQGEPEAFIDFRATQENPDGAVVDEQGCLWVAKWGTSEVARYSPEGQLLSTVPVSVRQPTCPAFGGPSLDTLFVTSAAVDLQNAGVADGTTFEVPIGIKGQAEHQVIL